MKTKEYPPIALLHEVTEFFPQAWSQMEDFHKHNGVGGLPAWPIWCYAPMSMAYAVVTSGAPFDAIEDTISAAQAAQCVAALAPWRLNKEVYVFDQDLAEALYEQDCDLDVPAEFLLSLPYDCFYVHTPGLAIDSAIIHGFFVHLEYDINTEERELRILFVPQEDTKMAIGFPIHIDSGSISNSMELTMMESVKTAMDLGRSDILHMAVSANEQANEYVGLLRKAVQLVLYILAENAEIEPDAEQHTTTHRGKVIRDKYREVRKWDVGFRTGSILRARKVSYAQSVSSNANGRTPPRPHLRRGHWHHYWTGPKVCQESRNLVLRWVAPIAVGGADENSPVVFHKITQDKKAEENQS